MPSALHEGLVALFRFRPRLAPELLAGPLGVELPAFTEVKVHDANLTQIAPTELRADLVVLLMDGRPVFAIIVEVQLGRDDQKVYSWPLYGPALRIRLRCPVCLMVVTPDPAVAAWAATPIDTGQPGAGFAPVVLGPGAVPWVTDPVQARRDPELAVLSALAHGKEERAIDVATAAMAAIAGLDEERALLYPDLVLTALAAAARKSLEDLMLAGKYELQSDFLKQFVAKGEAMGEARGEARGEAKAVVVVLEKRGLVLSEEERQRVLTCTDLATLDRWLAQALTAKDMEEALR